MLDDNPNYQHGFERDFFDNMEPEEMVMLATVGYYYIRERELQLKAQEQSRLSDGFVGERIAEKDRKEADRLAILLYERRNGECRAKEAAMSILAKYKNISMSKMLQKLKKEREEEKK